MSTFDLKAVLLDLSGTLHVEDSEITGSIDALRRLRESNLKVKFVTNTTKESKQFLVSRLNAIGLKIQPDEIFTSLSAARQLVDARGLRPLLLLDDRALGDFDGVLVDNPNAVIVGLAPEKFSYEDMNKAFRLLLDGASLVAIHKARYYWTKEGLCLGPGPFVSLLEYASGQCAEVVGKPQASFFLSAVAEWSVRPEECVMIGDDVIDDIEGAMKTGMQGILVQTGKYRKDDEKKTDSSTYGHCVQFC